MTLLQVDIWAGSDLTGQGYIPEPSDLEQLMDIDSKIQFRLPVKEFLSECGSYTNLSVPQVCVQQHLCLH